MKIEVVSAPCWIEKYQSEAQILWEKRQSTHLYNDSIAAVLDVSAEGATVCWIPYSARWAQESALLVPPLPICALSICAIVTCAEQILCGLRSTQVSSFPNHWEFAPAGGVTKMVTASSAIDLEDQILREWREELLTDLSPIQFLKPMGQLIHLPATRVWIFSFHIAVSPINPKKNREVSAWRWLTREQIEGEIANRRALWVAGTDLLLDQLPRL